DSLFHGELLRQLRLLQLYAQPLAKDRGVAAPSAAQYLYVARVRFSEPLADLYGSGLPCAVRTEQSEAFTRLDVEVDSRDGCNGTEAFREVGYEEGRRHGAMLSCGLEASTTNLTT